MIALSALVQIIIPKGEADLAPQAAGVGLTRAECCLLLWPAAQAARDRSDRSGWCRWMKFYSFRWWRSSPQGPQQLSPTQGLHPAHPTACLHFTLTTHPSSVCVSRRVPSPIQADSLSQKTALLLSPPQEPTGEMGSSKGKTAPCARPASLSGLPVSRLMPAWKEAQCIASPTPIPNTASVHTALQGTPPPSPLPPEGVPMLPVVPQMQTTVKNRASLLVPVSSGTRFSHKHTGWQSLLGKRGGPEPGLLGTDTE